MRAGDLPELPGQVFEPFVSDVKRFPANCAAHRVGQIGDGLAGITFVRGAVGTDRDRLTEPNQRGRQKRVAILVTDSGRDDLQIE